MNTHIGWKKLGIGFFIITSTAAMADSGPSGAPGIPLRWGPANKQAVGTAYEVEGASSPVWFTVAEGILTEVFYPTVDRPQLGDLQFLVTDGEGFFSEQKKDTEYQVSYLNEGMTVHIAGQDKTGHYAYDQLIITDPAAPVVRIHTTFKFFQPKLRVFILMKPAIDNSGAQNLAMVNEEGLFATRQPSNTTGTTFSALMSSAHWIADAAGYVGFSDGWQDISKNFHITEPFREAGPGNVAMVGELQTTDGPEFTYDLALGYGMSRSEAQTYAATSLNVPFWETEADYENGWTNYLKELQNSSMSQDRFMSESPLARHSAQIIKMHEDKRHRGALVASLSKPAVPYSDNAVDGLGGYHLVWPRDLYHAAMGLLAAGDLRTPVDILHYYEKTQRDDGSWPQNFWVDGTPYWQGLQMDEVSFPILLAAQLQFRRVYSLGSSEFEMIRKAASFLMAHGPATPQDRWEENGGYVPSTIAAEIAALRMAATLTQDASIGSVANQWESLLETWTLVQNGPYGKNYYPRLSPSGTPNAPETIDLANDAGKAYASEILDGGFLDLVRLGIRAPSDPRIQSTLQIYESSQLKIAGADLDSSGALIYRRYNRDQYGENHVGGFWPLLAGEKGHYAVKAKNLEAAATELYVLEKTANPAGLIPEQVIAPPSSVVKVGQGVACPLVWAHAEDILLHRSIEEGKVFDAPPEGQ